MRPLDYAFDVLVVGGRMKPLGGAFEVGGIGGRLKLTPTRIELVGVEGRRGDASLAANGHVDWSEAAAPRRTCW